MKQFNNLFTKVIIFCILLIISTASLVSCSSTQLSACTAGVSELENNVVSFCASKEGKYQLISDGQDYSNLILLMKLVAFNQEAFPEYVFNETAANNNDLLNMTLQTADSLTIDEISMYVSGDSRWDELIEAFARYKSAELDFRRADTVDVRKIYVEKKGELLEQLRPKIDVLISDLMGKYGISKRQPLLDFGIAIYKQST
jgi:hypothetical protein